MDYNLSSPKAIKQIKERDPAIFNYLVSKYSTILLKGAIKKGLGQDQAEEVLQATWTSFYEAANRFEGRSHVRTYLFGILYNKIKELWRYQKKFKDIYYNDESDPFDNMSGTEDAFYGALSGPETSLQRSQSAALIKKSIEALPTKQRKVFYLKEVIGDDTAQICQGLKISQTNLGVLLYRARKDLKLSLQCLYSS